MLGRLGEAEDLGWAALKRAGGPDSLSHLGPMPLPRGAIGAALRLAAVLHWQGRFRDADALFEAARSAAQLAAAGDDAREHASAMLAFADQHQGKARFDEGRYAEALALFEAALQRRQRAGSPADQLASSELAVRVARARLDAITAAGDPGRAGR